jgi:dTDP-glucose pyrophosphorylase
MNLQYAVQPSPDGLAQPLLKNGYGHNISSAS